MSGKPSKYIPIIFITLLLLPLGYYIYMVNQIVKKDERAFSSWAQVETAMQRKYDLIPNLVRLTKAHMKHEKEVFETIAKYRSQWNSSTTPEEKTKSAVQLDSAVQTLYAAVENYPNLKSSQSFQNLTVAIEGSENRIAIERRRFNEAIANYNTYIRTFPVRLLNYPPRKKYFEADAQATQHKSAL